MQWDDGEKTKEEKGIRVFSVSEVKRDILKVKGVYEEKMGMGM